MTMPLWQRVHHVDTDPGLGWAKDAEAALDAPIDGWAPGQDGRDAGVDWAAVPGDRSGDWRTHTPSCVRLEDGGYRMYYTESGPALAWSQSKGRILSARSEDGSRWTPEPGVRLAPHSDGAGLQVTSPELVPALAADGVTLGHRLYYEAIPEAMGADADATTIRSAFSTDGGLTFELEPGVRFGQPGQSVENFGSARVVYLPEGTGATCRMFLYLRVADEPDGYGLLGAEQDTDGGSSSNAKLAASDHASVYHIVSATCTDGIGLVFEPDPGIRIPQLSGALATFGGLLTYTPDVMYCAEEGYWRMYFSAWQQDPGADYPSGYILSATSEDCINFVLSNGGQPVMYPGGKWDRIKCSNPSVIALPGGRYRIFIEACDGSADGGFGVWRVSSATSTAQGAGIRHGGRL